jgi:hypothetical protein
VDGASTAADATAFLHAGPEKEIYNPALQPPASPYQLLVGTIISEAW